MELVSAAREYEQREPEASLGGFTDRLSLLSEVDEEQGTRDARIWLMTLHSAKGLEFPTVIMAGLEEGVFPHSRAFDEQDELDEERRLCYVGMTRARTQLVLTGAARRRVFGEYQAMEPSRFMDEVPPELVDRIEPAFLPALPEQLSGVVCRTRLWSRNGPNRASGFGRGRGRAREPESSYTPTYNYENEDQSVAARPAARRQGPASAIRRRHDPQRRGTGGRCEAGGAIFGGIENAAGEVREAGDGLARLLSGVRGKGCRENERACHACRLPRPLAPYP